ncbi:MAG: Trk family potassium uptake protein, partial [Clostridia bacterium]|nr:Trk family potassium uptake protein [Clostridia bacterium]
STLDMNSLLLPTQLMIMFLMFVGGSPGSTAGGIKTSTLALLGIAIVSIIQNRRETHVLNRRIEAAEVSRALAIALLGMLLIFVVTFLISFAHPGDFLRALFEVVSAIGTVGLSLGLTPELDDWGRILITATMFLGRLGPLTIGYALAYQRRQPNLRYPEGKIMIG